MQGQKINLGDITVGQALPWPMYDSDGRLLLRKGMIITSEGQLNSLVERGLYRRQGDGDGEVALAENAGRFEDTASPFGILDGLINRLPELYNKISQKQTEARQCVMRFASQLQELCLQDADAMIGAVHMDRSYPYIQYHPVHVAILSELAGKRLGFSDEERLMIIAAGLTANIAMLDLQEQLYHQEAPLTPEQQTAITRHPEASVKILVEAGVYDAKWLESIMQHHERFDGNGYPNGLKGDAICKEAQLISVADRYAAMVSGREYREARTSNEALKQFFQNKCEHCNEEMTLLFIKELGIWPPGTPVKLINGETGIVIRRVEDSMWPIVSSIISPRGGPYANPLIRDCNHEEYRIKDMTTYKKEMQLNLSLIWGFGS